MQLEVQAQKILEMIISRCKLYEHPLEFQSYEKIIEIGYRSGKEAIDAWSQAGSAAWLPDAKSEPVSVKLSQTLVDLDKVLNQMAQTVDESPVSSLA